MQSFDPSTAYLNETPPTPTSAASREMTLGSTARPTPNSNSPGDVAAFLSNIVNSVGLFGEAYAHHGAGPRG